MYVVFFGRVTVTVQRENGTSNFEKMPGEVVAFNELRKKVCVEKSNQQSSSLDHVINLFFSSPLPHALVVS